MTAPTPPAVSDAMREAVALASIASESGVELAIYMQRIKCSGWQRELRRAEAILGGPIASEIARLTGERDAALEDARDARYKAEQAEEAECDALFRAETAEAEITRLQAIIAALAPQPNGTEASRGVGAVPAGWKLVPEKPTPEMLKAGYGEHWSWSSGRAYRAMIAATPTPPLSPDSTGPAGRRGDATYYPTDLKGADLLGWIVGYYGMQMPEGLSGKLFDLMVDWHAERAATPTLPLSAGTEPAEICHDDQLAIWSGDIIGSLGMGGYLREDVSYDDKLHMYALVDAEVKGICAAITPSAPIAAPVRDDGALEAPEACLNISRRKLARITRAWEAKANLDDGDICFLIRMAEQRLDAPAGDVPGEAQTQEGRR